MKTVKVPLDYQELQIILQCIQSLNFSGQHVIPVGILGRKIQIELEKLEQEAVEPKKEVKNESTK